jgi:hypothetical protein
MLKRLVLFSLLLITSNAISVCAAGSFGGLVVPNMDDKRH